MGCTYHREKRSAQVSLRACSIHCVLEILNRRQKYSSCFHVVGGVKPVLCFDGGSDSSSLLFA